MLRNYLIGASMERYKSQLGNPEVIKSFQSIYLVVFNLNEITTAGTVPICCLMPHRVVLHNPGVVA